MNFRTTSKYFNYSGRIISCSFSAALLAPGLHMHAGVNNKAGGEKPMNVLFIMSDDLRPNIGCYGDSYAVTPNIDRLAASGVLFSSAYCQQAVSNPSRASLLTGLRPDENGVVNLVTHFRTKLPDVVTLPQLFKNNGYLAYGAGKIYHDSRNTIDPASWTESVYAYNTGRYILPENLEGGDKQNSTECVEVDDTAYIDGKVTNEAIKYMHRARKDNQPFFIAVGYKKPHAPYCAPKKYWDIYENTVFEIKNRERPEGSPQLAFHSNQELRGYKDIPKEGPIPSEKEQQVIRGYYACISYLDAQVGKLLDELETQGLSENTIIVLMGDHGYHLGEQDTWCKSTNFELDARVPLIIAAPRMNGNGKKSDAVVEFVDVYPTVAHLAGIRLQGKLSGKNLAPLLANPGKPWKNVAFNQFFRPYGALSGNRPQTHMGYSVRTDNWRCTNWYDLSTGEIVEKELYNLDEDRIEVENLVGRPEYRKVEKQLAKKLLDYRNGNYQK
ncbi:MAG: sulfatase [Bacteroidales bacterium]|nr:sulfatase [Bacteroidales bacterium]